MKRKKNDMNDKLRACLWSDFHHEHKWYIHFSGHEKNAYKYCNRDCTHLVKKLQTCKYIAIPIRYFPPEKSCSSFVAHKNPIE